MNNKQYTVPWKHVNYKFLIDYQVKLLAKEEVYNFVKIIQGAIVVTDEAFTLVCNGCSYI